MSKSLEDRLAVIEDKLAYLWAGNPPHPADVVPLPPVGAEFPKQVGSAVVYSADEEADLAKTEPA